MLSLKTLALCLAVVLATTSSDVHADSPTMTRHLRAQQDGGANNAYSPSNNNVNIQPGTVHTNIQITPGTSTTTVEAPPAPLAPAPMPMPAPAPMPMPAPAPMPMPMPAPAPAPAPMAPRPAPAPAPAGGGMFGGLMGGGGSPFTGAATMAHKAHGALLGHTGTVPSSYMQSQKSGGGGGHGH